MFTATLRAVLCYPSGRFRRGLLQPPRGTRDTGQDPSLPSRRPASIRPLSVTPPIVPAAFRKLDALAVLTGPSLPAPLMAGTDTKACDEDWYRILRWLAAAVDHGQDPSPRTVRPGDEAVAEVTSLLAPPRRTH